MKTALTLGLIAVLAACASLGADKAPGCHGARQPANPHGSVLLPEGQSPATPPAPAGATAGQCGGRR